jgi:hypothetical protein
MASDEKPGDDQESLAAYWAGRKDRQRKWSREYQRQHYHDDPDWRENYLARQWKSRLERKKRRRKEEGG